jgi:hypothetical protein
MVLGDAVRGAIFGTVVHGLIRIVLCRKMLVGLYFIVIV